MKITYAMGLFCINEGGRYFTLSLQPWNWLRIFLSFGAWRRVLEWGAHKDKR